MLVVMKTQATQEEIQEVCATIEQLGFRAHPLPAPSGPPSAYGNQGEVERGNLEALSGVAEVIRVSKATSWPAEVKDEDTVIRFAGTDAAIGGGSLAIIAGPCSIESREQPLPSRASGSAGAQFFRGGAFKPRTSLTHFKPGRRGAGHHGRDPLALRLRIVTEPSTTRASTRWRNGPMWCRSAHAICRTSRCSSARDGCASRCC